MYVGVLAKTVRRVTGQFVDLRTKNCVNTLLILRIKLLFFSVYMLEKGNTHTHPQFLPEESHFSVRPSTVDKSSRTTHMQKYLFLIGLRIWPLLLFLELQRYLLSLPTRLPLTKIIRQFFLWNFERQKISIVDLPWDPERDHTYLNKVYSTSTYLELISVCMYEVEK